MNNAPAARVKLRCCATSRKARSWREVKSIIEFCSTIIDLFELVLQGLWALISLNRGLIAQSNREREQGLVNDRSGGWSMRTIGHSEPQSAHGDYLLANSGRETGSRFAALSDLFDSVTIHHLQKCGVKCGWHCLEVGAGGGSIARWLADRVGRTGRVLATDIDIRFLEPLKSPNLEVLRHNIALDSLPQGVFDLVHARLVLLHLPQRENALEHMISGLKPGGWIVC